MEKRIFEQPEKSVRQVYHEVIAQSVSPLRADYAAEEIGVALPTLERVKSSLDCVRATMRPPVPRYLAEMNPSDELTVTKDGDRFLIVYDGTTDRLIGFCTHECLEV